MAYEQRDNTGTLGKNLRKEKPSHPDTKGKALIGGKWYWISGWTKDGKDGSKFSSLSFELMKDQPAAQTSTPAPVQPGDDNLPF